MARLNLADRECAFARCQRSFTPHQRNQMYCKPQCRMLDWQRKHQITVKIQGDKPTRREAWLLVCGWKVAKIERMGAVTRIWWKDPVSGDVMQQKEALEVELNR